VDLNPLVWTDMGTASPSPSAQLPIPTWKANNPYKSGDVIFSPANGHYYTAIQDGTSGMPEPTFLANKQLLVPEEVPTIDKKSVSEVFTDHTGATQPGDWKDVGLESDQAARNACPAAKDSEDWGAHQPYQNDSCILDPYSKHYFKLIITAALGIVNSGSVRPVFPSTPHLQNLASIQWEDSGTSPPSIVTSGQPADQTVTMTYTLPQVHAKYYYNLSTGVVFSSVRSRTFGWKTVTLPTGSGPSATLGLYDPIQTGSNVIVDPVLFFTAYIWPMDAESIWHKGDLRPAVTFGLSLASPASNFYVGLSSEVRRNVQIVYGFTAASTGKLAAGSGPSTTNTTPPGTVQVFRPGAFIGVSYNISGFLQSLFGGGKP
jgi:hypothetical protein